MTPAHKCEPGAQQLSSNNIMHSKRSMCLSAAQQLRWRRVSCSLTHVVAQRSQMTNAAASQACSSHARARLNRLAHGRCELASCCARPQAGRHRPALHDHSCAQVRKLKCALTNCAATWAGADSLQLSCTLQLSCPQCTSWQCTCAVLYKVAESCVNTLLRNV